LAEENLVTKFKDSSSKYSAETAIQHKKGEKWIDLSFGDLGLKVVSLSGFLLRRGVRKDDKIALLFRNRPEWPLIFFATVSLGAVAIPLNPDANEKEIEGILRDSDCRFVFTSDGELFDKISSLESSLLKKIVSVDSDEFKKAVSCPEHFSGTKTEISPDDLACLLYTSGTTDKPKGVMLSHKNLLSNTSSLNQSKIFSPEDRILSILPLHHAYSLTVTMMLPLLFGGSIVYPGSIRTDELLKTMIEVNPTMFVVVPQMLHLFSKNIEDRLEKMHFLARFFLKAVLNFLYKFRKRTGINLTPLLLRGSHSKFGRSLRFFVSGGAKLDEDVEKLLFKFGFTVLEGYGLTETSPVLTMNLPEEYKIGSAGRAVPGVELKIENKDKSGVGEIVVRGPNIMKGYYHRDDLTAEVIKEGGWFHTGDLGYVNRKGFLFLTGRLKEVIVLSSGLNIYPEEIEDAYSKHQAIKEICVFEVPFKKGQEERLVLWAVIVPDIEFFRKYTEVNLEFLLRERLANISKKLPPSKRIMGFTITLEKFPRTVLGKIKRFAVKETYLPRIIRGEKQVSKQKELSEEDKELLGSDAGRKIIEYLKKQTRTKKDIIPDDMLEIDLGIDSLGRIELASGLEKAFGMKIKDEIIGRAFTVRELITGVASLGKEGPAPGPQKEKVYGPEDWGRLLRVPPREENLKKIDRNPGFGSWLVGFFFIRLIYVIFRIFYNLKVEGRENFPETGPCIVYANHISFFDGFLVGVSLPHPPRLDLFFIGFRVFFSAPIVRNLIKLGRLIPLDFSTHLLEALRSGYYVLEGGRKVCLFPEGMRTLDGNVSRFKKGFGVLVKESNAKLVPLIIKGAYEAWPRTSKFPKRHPITVKIGKVLDPAEVEKEGFRLGAEDSYEAICVGARKALIELKGKR